MSRIECSKDNHLVTPAHISKSHEFVPSLLMGSVIPYQKVAIAIISDSYLISDPKLAHRVFSDARLFRLMKSCAMLGWNSSSYDSLANVLTISLSVDTVTYRFDWAITEDRVDLIAIHIEKAGLSLSMARRSCRTPEFEKVAA